MNYDVRESINIANSNIFVSTRPTTRSDCNKHTIKREHYTRKNGEWKPKKCFASQEEAEAWIKKYKMTKYTSYVCGVCGCWHIGIKH